ncbi:T9SS type A sorting domain-containing protein [bacterium]|nr:T9SS type A sorting domain-containing protein [bacterium]
MHSTNRILTLTLFYCLALLLLPVSRIHAQWSTEDGSVVVDTHILQFDLLEDGEGGAWIAYKRLMPGRLEVVRVNRIDAEGNLLFGPEGIPVIPDREDGTMPYTVFYGITPTLNSDVHVTFGTNRIDSTWWNIYVQRISLEGELVYGPTAKVVSAREMHQLPGDNDLNDHAISDGAGGLYALYHEMWESDRWYIAGINADGSQKFETDPDIRHVDGGLSSRARKIFLGPDGGVGITYEYDFQGDRDIRYQYFHPDGSREYSYLGLPIFYSGLEYHTSMFHLADGKRLFVFHLESGFNIQVMRADHSFLYDFAGLKFRGYRPPSAPSISAIFDQENEEINLVQCPRDSIITFNKIKLQGNEIDTSLVTLRYRESFTIPGRHAYLFKSDNYYFSSVTTVKDDKDNEVLQLWNLNGISVWGSKYLKIPLASNVIKSVEDGKGGLFHGIHEDFGDLPIPVKIFHILPEGRVDGRDSTSLMDQFPPIPTTLKITSVSPNPTNGEFRVSFETDHEGSHEFKIYNLNGQLVQDISRHCQAGNYDQSLNLPSNVSAGLYFLRISNSREQSAYMKIVYLK